MLNFKKGHTSFVTALIVLAGTSVIIPPAAVSAGLPPVKEFIELNHPIKENMVTYPGLSEVKLYAVAPRGKNGALVDGIKLLGISGTYIDAPYHVEESGAKISDYPLNKLVNLPVIMVDMPLSRKEFLPSDFEKLDVTGKAVLLNTKQDRHFGSSSYDKDAPFLSAAAADWLVKHGATLVGIDSVLIDDLSHSEQEVPAHDILLKGGVVIAEDMTNLDSLNGKKAYLTAVPPRVPMASFPARIFATVY